MVDEVLASKEILRSRGTAWEKVSYDITLTRTSVHENAHIDSKRSTVHRLRIRSGDYFAIHAVINLDELEQIIDTLLEAKNKLDVYKSLEDTDNE